MVSCISSAVVLVGLSMFKVTKIRLHLTLLPFMLQRALTILFSTTEMSLPEESQQSFHYLPSAASRSSSSDSQQILSSKLPQDRWRGAVFRHFLQFQLCITLSMGHSEAINLHWWESGWKPYSILDNKPLKRGVNVVPWKAEGLTEGRCQVRYHWKPKPLKTCLDLHSSARQELLVGK